MHLKSILLSVILVTSFTLLRAQQYAEPVDTDIPSVQTRYMGFNTNLMLRQFIPFNHINIPATNASILFRSYNELERGYRAGFGVALESNNKAGGQLLFLSIESDNRRVLSPRWYFFQGFGLQLNIKSPSGFDRNLSASNDIQAFLGIGWHFGAEYKMNDFISLSAESTFRAGLNLSEGGGLLRIDPPINIMAHFNLSNKN